MLRRGLHYESGLFISTSQGSSQLQAVVWNPQSESPWAWHMAVILQSEGVTLLSLLDSERLWVTVCTLEAVERNPSQTVQLVAQHIGCPDVGWAQALLLLHVGTKRACLSTSCTLEKCTGFLTNKDPSVSWPAEHSLFLSSDSDLAT